MGSTNIRDIASLPMTLVIFTCEGREHLLYNTFNSFKASCNYSFFKTVLAIDGKINPGVIDHIQPDVVIQSPVRKGYVNNILQALAQIDTHYFFWLEDDWKFHTKIDLSSITERLIAHPNWVEIIYNKNGPLTADEKKTHLEDNLYQTPYGFSANPCICRTAFIKDGFSNLLSEPKGDKLGEDGFENSLSKYFKKQNLICVFHDPVDHTVISHEGYLESTPRNWHMTNSLDQKTEKHLLTITKPSLVRKLAMILKLTGTFLKLSFRQLVNDEIYEFCFRIIASAKTIKKDE
ncbi:MAG: hypothetical protein JST50_01880 [Bacteroidetes bacterium]|jgi:hypothetical protein|nr:hypothetical protein [Bacteroidota bacterium]